VLLALLMMVQEGDEIAREVALANAKDKPLIQHQVLRKLSDRRAAAVADEVLHFTGKNGHNSLASGFTQWLGSLKDDRIAKLLSELVADRNFYWRPQAMRALAQHGDKRYLEDFRAGLSDPQWGCRAATILALQGIEDRESIPKIRSLLGDEVYDVRAQAAKTLHAFGDTSGLPVLVEALRDETTWFEIDYGQIAREDAWNFLKTLSKDDFGYKPWETTQQRAGGMAKWDAWIARSIPDWRERVPGKARARTEAEEFVFGYELRSCQRGDFFLRIDTKGNLVLGCFNLERAALSAEEMKAFTSAVEKVASVDRRTLYGRPGCDFELFHLKIGGHFERLSVGLQGRPDGVQPWIKRVAGLLREKFGEGVASEFRDKCILFQAEE
jgi:hypothetical protein